MLYSHSFLTNNLLLDKETAAQAHDIAALAKFQQTLQQLPDISLFSPGDLVLIKSLSSLLFTLSLL